MVGLFTALSWGVKRAGLRVTPTAWHSVVNIVDVGALLVLGIAGGAVVAGASAFLHVTTSRYRSGARRPQSLLAAPLVDGAVKSLVALAGGTLYAVLGGRFGPLSIPRDQWLPLGALFVLWFLLDHLLWAGMLLLQHGPTRAAPQLRRALPISVLLELVPLPFAVAFAAAWGLSDLPLKGLLLVATVLGALGVRWLGRALGESRSQVRRISLLNQFGSALVQAQLDEQRVAALLVEHARRLAPDADAALDLQPESADPAPLLVAEPSALPEIAWTLRPGDPAGAGTGDTIQVPLRLREQRLGTLRVTRRAGTGRLTDEDGRVLAVMAAQGAVALQNARRYEAVRRQSLQLETIAAVSRLVASTLNLNTLLQAVVDRVQQTFNYYHVQIYLVDESGERMVLRAGSGPAGVALARLDMSQPIDGEGIISWVVRHRSPLLVPDVSQEPRYLPDHPRLLADTRAELAVPLMVDDGVVGVLDVQSNQIGALDREDQFTLTTLADQLALAIEEARLYVAEREQAWVTRGLLILTERLNPLVQMEDILRTVVDLAPELLEMDAAALFLWQEAERSYIGQASAGLAPALATLLDGQRLARGDFPLLAEAERRREIVLVPHADDSPLVPPPIAALVGPVGLRALPLAAQGSYVGVLVLAERAGLRKLSSRREALLAGLGRQASAAIQAAIWYAERQQEAATTERLLGLAEAIAARAPLQVTLAHAATLLAHLPFVTGAALYRLDDEGQLVLEAADGFESTRRPAARLALNADTLASLDRLARPGEPPSFTLQEGAPLGLLLDREFVAALPLVAQERTLGLLAVDLRDASGRLTRAAERLLSGVARQSAIALATERLYHEALQNERRTQELELARELQRALLPAGAPEVPGYDFAGYWRPAFEVAGDFYGFLQLSDDEVGVTIADVADKGIAAAFFMVLARTALRESLWSEPGPAAALTRTNHQIARDVRTTTMFLTLVQVNLWPASGRMLIANAGHIPPYHYHHATDALSSFFPRHLPMGIFEEVSYEEAELWLEPGDALVLITDGITESRGAGDELFGATRAASAVYTHRFAPATELVAHLLDQVEQFSAGRPPEDDITVIVLRRAPP